jgi:hypothetical protein
MNVDDYIDSLPEDRRIAMRCVRELVNSRIPAGYEEGFLHGMISWFVPFTRLAETYNNEPLAVASLGSQTGHMALYLSSIYADDKLRSWFETAYKKTGKRLDMGKSCVRFKTIDALPLDVVGDAIAKVSVDAYVAQYEKVRATTGAAKAKPAKAKPAKAKTAAKKAAKAAPKKPATKAKAKAKTKSKTKKSAKKSGKKR